MVEPEFDPDDAALSANDSESPGELIAKRQTHRETRKAYEAGVTLLLDNDTEFRGRTTNVSHHGAFFQVDRQMKGISIGDSGMATVAIFQEAKLFSSVFPCIVVWIGVDGLGLRFEDPDLLPFGDIIDELE